MLSAQRALLGAVTDNLFAIAIGRIEDESALLYAYFIGEPSSEDRDNIFDVAAEMTGDFYAPTNVEARFFDVTHLSEIDTLEFVAFAKARTDATEHLRFV